MEQAKHAVSSFLSKGGQERTDVDEVVNPAVTSETIKPHRHEETTEAVDREVHQDHYHTTVQPISHKETLPERHTHNIVPQVEKTIEHGSVEQDRSRVAADLGQFKDTSTTVGTTQSTSAAPTVVGEHVHHHVHETVQPVIHKETIQPEVVHTTIPIHEKHIAPSEHHGLSNLPMKTLDEFKQGGVDLTTGHHAQHEYEGHPRPYDPKLQVERAPVDVNPKAHEGTHDPEKTGHFEYLSSGRGSTGTGVTGATGATGATSPHQTTDEHHGSGLATGAATGAAAGAGAAALSSHHGQDRSLESTTTGGSTSATGVSGAHHGLQETTPNTATQGIDKTSSSATHGANPGTYQGDRDEPSNLSGGAKFDDTDKVQHASQMGEDPSLTKSKEAESGKWRGDGVPGSHSAVFGLTKDGKTYDDTANFVPGGPKSTTGDEDSKRDSGVGTDSGSRASDSGTGKVAEQMHDPKVAEPAHSGSAEYKPDSSTKPGHGADTSKIV